ncbi:MAG: dihydroorotate dehydrogenase [Chitinispirillales bacterium]|nr:dihydroorotate dehydrogenase [Chitinispirillales bacterium]
MGTNVDLSVRIGTNVFANPVGVASGTFGYGGEYGGLVDFSDIGAIYTKAVTLEPRGGNPAPRLVETPSGILNSIGLANVGVEKFISDKLPFLKSLPCAVVVNVAGSTEDEYLRVIERLESVDASDVNGNGTVSTVNLSGLLRRFAPRNDRHCERSEAIQIIDNGSIDTGGVNNNGSGVFGYEINVSCPNVNHGGLAFGTDPAQIERLTSSLRRLTKKPLIIKLTPNVTDIATIAKAAESGGADAVSLINTLVGMVIDVKTRKPVLGAKTGGLSGPAVRPVGVALTYRVKRAVSIPVIGMGGITCADDALQYILAGASAVQIGTANFINPRTAGLVSAGIREYCVNNGVSSLKDICGIVE